MGILFRYAGVFFVVNTREHPPAHVHVRSHSRRPDWEIRIFLGNESDGSTDDYGRSFGDVTIVTGKLKPSKIAEYVNYLAQHIDEAWDLWHQING